MTALFVAQEVRETLRSGTPALESAQLVRETLRAGTPSLQVAQLVREVLISPGVLNIAAVATSASARAVGAQPGITPGGVAAAGAARGLSISVSVKLQGAGSFALARGAIPSPSVALGGVSASGGAARLGIETGFQLRPAIAVPDAAPITFGQQIPFPVFSLMRDTPVACFGSMADTPIALIGRMPPSGPQPRGTQVFLQGVGARAFAGTVTPFFNVYVHLQPATATGVAAPVIAA